MKLWRTVLCITWTMIFSGLTLAQGTKASTDLKQKIKTFQNRALNIDRQIPEVDITPLQSKQFAAT
ncbi:hypothetical protein BH20ACI3_BH20ACI3_08310 [soil metagenome]